MHFNASLWAQASARLSSRRLLVCDLAQPSPCLRSDLARQPCTPPASLRSQLGEAWPGADGAAELAREVASFRATRSRLKEGCAACERAGAAACLERARAAADFPPPHLCWSLRQDTRSWSEHFFVRMALRFDARAALRERAGASDEGHGGRRAGRAGAGVRTGNVRWWRCPRSRRVASACAQLPPGAAQPKYSAWHCLCTWREAQGALPRRWGD